MVQREERDTGHRVPLEVHILLSLLVWRARMDNGTMGYGKGADRKVKEQELSISSPRLEVGEGTRHEGKEHSG